MIGWSDEYSNFELKNHKLKKNQINNNYIVLFFLEVNQLFEQINPIILV